MWEMESKEPFPKKIILTCHYIFCRNRQVTVLPRSADLKQQNQRESCPKNKTGIFLLELNQIFLNSVSWWLWLRNCNWTWALGIHQNSIRFVCRHVCYAKVHNSLNPKNNRPLQCFDIYCASFQWNTKKWNEHRNVSRNPAESFTFFPREHSIYWGITFPAKIHYCLYSETINEK